MAAQHNFLCPVLEQQRRIDVRCNVRANWANWEIPEYCLVGNKLHDIGTAHGLGYSLIPIPVFSSVSEAFFDTAISIWTTLEISILCLCLVRSVSRNATKHFMRQFVVMSIFFTTYGWLCLWLNWYCANKRRVCFPVYQNKCLHKIFLQ